MPQTLPVQGLAQSVHSPDGQRAFVSGSYRLMALTDDGGDSWQQLEVNEPLAGVMLLDSLRAAWSLDANTLIAAGHNFFEVQEIIIRSTDGGAQWQIVHLGPDYTGLDDMHFTSATSGIAIGQQGRILRTTDAGASWSQQPSPTDRWLHDLVYLDAQRAFACGDEVIIRTVNGGLSWQALPTHACDCYDLAVGTSDVLYMSGTVNFGQYPSLLRSADGGNTWATLDTPFDPSGAVYAFGADTVYSAAYEGLYASFDAGVSWYFFEETEGHWIQDIKFHDAHSGFAVGVGSTAFRTDDRGGTPRPVARFEVSDASPCQGDAASFTNLSPPGLGYTWLVDGEVSGTDASFTFAFEQAGPHTVELIVQHGNLADTATTTINVLPAASVQPFTLNAGPDSVCAGSTFVLDIASTANTAYQVHINGAAVTGWLGAGQATNPTSYPAGQGDVFLEVIGRSIGFCDTAYLAVRDTIRTIPLPGPVALTATVATVCAGATTQVLLAATYPQVAYSVSIRYSAPPPYTTVSAVQGDGGDHIIPLDPIFGAATVWCIGENVLGCARAVSDTLVIQVDTVLARFRSEPLIAFAGEPTVLIASGYGLPVLWEAGPNASPSVASGDSLEVVFTSSALHQPIILTAQNSTGCTHTDTLELTVLAPVDTLSALACRIDTTGLHFGTSSARDHVLDFVVGPYGERVVAGLWRNSYGSYYGHAALIAKYDRDGQLLWEHRAPALNQERSSAAMAVDVDATGNIYVTAHFHASSWSFAGGAFYWPQTYSDSHQGVLLKFSPDGTLLWAVHAGPGTRGVPDVLVAQDGTVHFVTHGLPEVVKFANGGTIDISECCEVPSAYTVVHVDTNGHYIDLMQGPLRVGQYLSGHVVYYPYTTWGNTNYWELVNPTLFAHCDGRIGVVDHVTRNVSIGGQVHGPGTYGRALVVGLSDPERTHLEQGWTIAEHYSVATRPTVAPDLDGNGLMIELSGSFWSGSLSIADTFLLANGTSITGPGAGALVHLDLQSGTLDRVLETRNLVGAEILALPDGTYAYLATATGHAGIASIGGEAQGLAPLGERAIVLTRLDGEGNILSMDAYGNALYDNALEMDQRGCCEFEVVGIANGPLQIQNTAVNDPYGVFFARFSLDGTCHPVMPDDLIFGCCGDTLVACQGSDAPVHLAWSATGSPSTVSLSWTAAGTGPNVIANALAPSVSTYAWSMPAEAYAAGEVRVFIASDNGQTDSLLITIAPPPTVDLAASATTTCQGDTIHLNATTGMASYTWQETLAGGSAFVATESGVYTVLVHAANGCAATDQLALTFLPTDLWAYADTLCCTDQPVPLAVEAGFDAYLWSTGSTTEQTTITGPAMVSVQAWYGADCLVQDTLQVTFALPATLTLQLPALTCIGDFLHVTASTPVDLLWNSGSTSDSTMIMPGPHYYTVHGTTPEGCVSVDSVLVAGVPCDVGIAEHGTAPALQATWSANAQLIHITWSGPVEQVTLHDATGRLLRARNTTPAHRTLDLDAAELATGVYLLNATTPHGRLQTVRLLKP